MDREDQYRIVRAALAGLEMHTEPGQVNVLDCRWGNTEDFCATAGGAEVVLRRDSVIRYQNQADLEAAVAQYGAKEADGIVSAEATRQREVLRY